jgi:hypothetical protein
MLKMSTFSSSTYFCPFYSRMYSALKSFLVTDECGYINNVMIEARIYVHIALINKMCHVPPYIEVKTVEVCELW